MNIAFAIIFAIFVIVLIVSTVFSFVQGKKAAARKQEFLNACLPEEKAVIERYIEFVNQRANRESEE